MAKLTYSMFTSLDGYAEDGHGGFGWGAPEDEELHSWIIALASSFGTCLYGRRVYETMAVLGDRAHGSRSATVRARLCEAVAGGGEDRLLEDPRRAAQRTDEDRAGFRSRWGPEAQGKRPSDIAVDGPELAAQAIQGESCRRVPNACLPSGRRRRKTVLPGWCAAGPRAGRGATLP